MTEGGNLILSGVIIGAVTQNSGGTLILTFGANSTQARVDEAMRSITYENSSATPPASLDIEGTFSDGNTGALTLPLTVLLATRLVCAIHRRYRPDATFRKFAISFWISSPSQPDHAEALDVIVGAADQRTELSLRIPHRCTGA